MGILPTPEGPLSVSLGTPASAEWGTPASISVSHSPPPPRLGTRYFPAIDERVLRLPDRIINSNHFPRPIPFDPSATAVHPTTSDLYVCDQRNHRVHVLRKNFDYKFGFGRKGTKAGQFRWPCAIAVTEAEVFVSDTFNHRVQVFSLEGDFLRTFGTKGHGDAQFMNPVGVACRNDSIYVCDFKRIKVFTMGGDFLRAYFDPTVQSLWGIAFADDGHRFVVTDNFGTASDGRVYVFDTRQDGCAVRFAAFGSETGQVRHPCGVAVDGDGRILVADWSNRRVQVFAANGEFLRLVETEHPPSDVATLPGGGVVVCTDNMSEPDCATRGLFFYDNL